MGYDRLAHTWFDVCAFSVLGMPLTLPEPCVDGTVMCPLCREDGMAQRGCVTCQSHLDKQNCQTGPKVLALNLLFLL